MGSGNRSCLDHLNRCLAAIKGAFPKACGVYVNGKRASISTQKGYSDGLVQEGGYSMSTRISIKVVYKRIALCFWGDSTDHSKPNYFLGYKRAQGDEVYFLWGRFLRSYESHLDGFVIEPNFTLKYIDWIDGNNNDGNEVGMLKSTVLEITVFSRVYADFVGWGTVEIVVSRCPSDVEKKRHLDQLTMFEKDLGEERFAIEVEEVEEEEADEFEYAIAVLWVCVFIFFTL
jgi:hypothetical protein